ncbi:hypothetical protein [Desulfovibrio psychrotolerans]|uniref:Uncharacterized protein n=1 Tax=Desulfovibrio psychrotolerans TaxID=415242 RepID=A0A7J0BWV5_9BACT|nr:hypothetical protein [Desulfovibrio psychrotolerans]GFM38199.1 hypothetical protein DSM19430T_28830 [Desulfovibrio psychrotolerans]
MNIILGFVLYAVAVITCVWLAREASRRLSFHHSSLCGTGRLRKGLRPMRHQAEHLCLGMMCPSHDADCVRRRG